MEKQTILIIDDDMDILEAMQFMLESEGYDVQISNSYETLSKITPKNKPTLIILDVYLSGMDGRHICKKLKEAKITKLIPIIMISAHPNAEKSMLECKADTFLAKPIEMDDLLNAIASYLNK